MADEDGARGWVGRWVVLAAALLVQSVGGLFYAFGLYSDQLKANFDLSQEQVNYIATASNVGGNFGAHLGLLYDAYGPQPVLAIAVSLGLAGWVPMWYALNHPWKAPYPLLLTFAFLQGHAQMAGDLAAVPTVGGNFSKHRGLAIGLAKSFVGLSGALATQYYAGIFKPQHYKCLPDLACHRHNGTCGDSCSYWEPAAAADDAEVCMKCQGFIPFLVFVACLVGGFGVIGILFMRRLPPTVSESPLKRATATRYLNQLVAITMVIALMCGAASLTEKFVGDVSSTERLVMMGVVQGTFLLMLIYAATRKDTETTDDNQGLLETITTGSVQSELAEEIKEYSVVEAMAIPQFWLLFLSFFIGVGSGMMLINNIAQILDADAGHKGSDKTVFVTLLSVCNCWGRLLSGLLGDYLLTRSIPRPVVLSLGLALMAVAQVLIMVGTTPCLYLACVIGGVAYGSFNALPPTLVSEMFGQKNFASIYAINSLAGAAASIGVASQMAGALYDEHAHKDKFDPGNKVCYGKQCYFTTALICASGCAFAVVLGLIMARLTKRRYYVLYADIRTKKAR